MSHTSDAFRYRLACMMQPPAPKDPDEEKTEDAEFEIIEPNQLPSAPETPEDQWDEDQPNDPGVPTRLLVMVGLENSPGVSRDQRVAFRLVVVHIEMTLYFGQYRNRGITVRMEGRDRGQCEENLRQELISHTSINLEFYGESMNVTGTPDFEKMAIEILDPTGILQWLGIDIREQFKKAYNDKPLRLPSEDSRKSIG